MTYYAGIDVSLETSSICIVDAQGAIRREFKAESEPEATAAALVATGLAFSRIGLEAGPLSQWLHAGLAKAGLPVVLLETRQLRATTKSMPVKTDRNDARAMAQVVRTGWFKAVHVKSELSLSRAARVQSSCPTSFRHSSSTRWSPAQTHAARHSPACASTSSRSSPNWWAPHANGYLCQHKQDPDQRCTIRRSRPPALRLQPPWRQQRLEHQPKVVRDKKRDASPTAQAGFCPQLLTLCWLHKVCFADPD